MKLFSDQWIDLYEKVVKEFFSEGKTPTGIDGKVLEKFLHVKAQNGQDVWIAYEWEDGVIVEQSHGVGLDTAPRDADFTLLLDMTLPKKILTGKVKLSEIMESGLVDLKVNYINFMPVENAFIDMQKMKIICKIKPEILRNPFLHAMKKKAALKRDELLQRGFVLR